MNQQQLRDRTKDFARRVVRLCHSLPREWDIREMGKQLLRSGTSVAANYRACGCARSDKEFCSKLGVVVEEADESQLWLELLPEAYPDIQTNLYKGLLTEAGELTAIFYGIVPYGQVESEEKEGREEKGARQRYRAPLDFQIPRFQNFQITR